MTTESRFIALKSKKKKVLDRGQNDFQCEDNNNYNYVFFVCFLPIHSGQHQVRWTYVPAGVTQEKGLTGFLIPLLSAVRALIFLARKIQPFLSLVDREVEFCVLTN